MVTTPTAHCSLPASYCQYRSPDRFVARSNALKAVWCLKSCSFLFPNQHPRYTRSTSLRVSSDIGQNNGVHLTRASLSIDAMGISHCCLRMLWVADRFSQVNTFLPSPIQSWNGLSDGSKIWTILGMWE
jgi:hypothetical protein